MSLLDPKTARAARKDMGGLDERLAWVVTMEDERGLEKVVFETRLSDKEDFAETCTKVAAKAIADHYTPKETKT